MSVPNPNDSALGRALSAPDTGETVLNLESLSNTGTSGMQAVYVSNTARTVWTVPRVHCLWEETPLEGFTELGHVRHSKTHTFITTWCVLVSCVSCWVRHHTAREVLVVSSLYIVGARRGRNFGPPPGGRVSAERKTQDTGVTVTCAASAAHGRVAGAVPPQTIPIGGTTQVSETQTGMSKQTNEERRAERLRREIQKQHGWRVKTWAVAMKYIDERQKELAALGFDEEELFQPDFNNPAMVEEYASGLIPT